MLTAAELRRIESEAPARWPDAKDVIQTLVAEARRRHREADEETRTFRNWYRAARQRNAAAVAARTAVSGERDWRPGIELTRLAEAELGAARESLHAFYAAHPELLEGVDADD